MEGGKVKKVGRGEKTNDEGMKFVVRWKVVRSKRLVRVKKQMTVFWFQPVFPFRCRYQLFFISYIPARKKATKEQKPTLRRPP